MLGKRKRVSSKRAVQTSMRVGNWASLARASRARPRPRSTQAYMVQRLSSQIRSIQRTIETKEGTWTSAVNVQLPHNNTYVVQMTAGGALNPLRTTNGADDPMGGNAGSRIGDKITIKGLAIRGMVEAALGRSKVYFRIMLVKCPRGQTPDRASPLFKGCSGNKMIDTVNTEKFTIIWQKVFTVTSANTVANAVGANGVPTGGTVAGITGNRVFKAFIPGSKFGRGGTIQYEDTSSINPKFFDYRIVILCYDWYGTPQDVNNVGILNEMYTKMYFKDA